MQLNHNQSPVKLPTIFSDQLSPFQSFYRPSTSQQLQHNTIGNNGKEGGQSLRKH